MLTLDLILEAAASEEKLTHLEHNEDHVIHGGHEGFAHAINNLNAVSNKLKTGRGDVDIQVKHDGSPSFLAGYHPENGRFFVASKSAFNATPKINYTPEDIERNHGHAPGLVTKLKAALKHLPKVMPKTGVFQGDLMYSRGAEDDVEAKDGKYSFTPNTIKYSTPMNSSEGAKIDKAKVGALIHTAYHGPSFDKLKAEFTPDKSVFKEHKDVHLFNNAQELEGTKYTKDQQDQFEKEMLKAEHAHRSAPEGAFDHTLPHEEHLKTYMNQTVRDGTEPSVEGYKKHLADKWAKKTEKLKTDKAKNERNAELLGHITHVDQHKESFESVLNMHKHLQNAKNILVNALSSHQRYEHSIGDKTAKPEGYVIVRNNRPSKFVDRAEFSRANFERSANR